MDRSLSERMDLTPGDQHRSFAANVEMYTERVEAAAMARIGHLPNLSTRAETATILEALGASGLVIRPHRTLPENEPTQRDVLVQIVGRYLSRFCTERLPAPFPTESLIAALVGIRCDNPTTADFKYRIGAIDRVQSSGISNEVFWDVLDVVSDGFGSMLGAFRPRAGSGNQSELLGVAMRPGYPVERLLEECEGNAIGLLRASLCRHMFEQALREQIPFERLGTTPQATRGRLTVHDGGQDAEGHQFWGLVPDCPLHPYDVVVFTKGDFVKILEGTNVLFEGLIDPVMASRDSVVRAVERFKAPVDMWTQRGVPFKDWASLFVTQCRAEVGRYGNTSS